MSDLLLHVNVSSVETRDIVTSVIHINIEICEVGFNYFIPSSIRMPMKISSHTYNVGYFIFLVALVLSISMYPQYLSILWNSLYLLIKEGKELTSDVSKTCTFSASTFFFSSTVVNFAVEFK